MQFKRTAAVAVAGLVLTGVGGGIVVSHHRTQAEIAETVAQATTVIDESVRADGAQDAAIHAATKLLSDTEGKVADDAVRVALSNAVQAARDAQVTVRVDEEGYGLDAARALLAEANTQSKTILDADDALNDAVKAVQVAHDDWVLGQAVAAHAEARKTLEAALIAGDQVLGGSDGKVSDDAVRQALANALDAGRAKFSESVETDVAKLDASTRVLNDVAVDVGAKTGAVDDAVAVKVEADRKAAEAAAARKAADQKAAQQQKSSGSSSSKSSGSSSGSSSSSKSSGSSSGSGSTSGGTTTTRPPKIGGGQVQPDGVTNPNWDGKTTFG